MPYANGFIPLDALTPIGGGLYLEHKAAVAWIAARAVVFAETGIMPIVSAPDGAYRDYAGQVRQKQLAIKDGQPNRAATPGHSTHGTGISLDIWNISRYRLAQLEQIMARFGFRRNISYESWHFTHNGTTTAGTTPTQIEDDMPLNDDDKAYIRDQASKGGAYVIQVNATDTTSAASAIVSPGFVRPLNSEEFQQAIGRYPLVNVGSNRRAFDVHVSIHSGPAAPALTFPPLDLAAIAAVVDGALADDFAAVPIAVADEQAERLQD